jgi:hypothetical protein
MSQYQEHCATCNHGFKNPSAKSRHYRDNPTHKPNDYKTRSTRKSTRQVASDSDSGDVEDNINFDDSVFTEADQSEPLSTQPVITPLPLPAQIPQPDQSAQITQPAQIAQPVATPEPQPVFKQSTSASNTVKGRRITLDITCEQFMQIGFILCGSAKSANLAELVSALSEKCVERKLDQSYVKTSIDTLQMLKEFHSSNFRLEKSDLNQQFSFNSMTENQKKAIID